MKMVEGLAVTGDKAAAAQQIKALYTLFDKCDCTMVEVGRTALGLAAGPGAVGAPGCLEASSLCSEGYCRLLTMATDRSTVALASWRHRAPT